MRGGANLSDGAGEAIQRQCGHHSGLGPQVGSHPAKNLPQAGLRRRERGVPYSTLVAVFGRSCRRQQRRSGVRRWQQGVDVWGEWEFCLHARYMNYGGGIVGATGTIHFFKNSGPAFKLVVVQLFRIDPVSFWILTPWIRDWGWTSRIIFPRALKQFFGLRYLNSLMRTRMRIRESFWPWILDPVWEKLGSGINILDPHKTANCPSKRLWITKSRYLSLYLCLYEGGSEFEKWIFRVRIVAKSLPGGGWYGWLVQVGACFGCENQYYSRRKKRLLEEVKILLETHPRLEVSCSHWECTFKSNSTVNYSTFYLYLRSLPRLLIPFPPSPLPWPSCSFVDTFFSWNILNPRSLFIS